MSNKSKNTKENESPAVPAVNENAAPETAKKDEPTADNSTLVTVNDLVLIVKFLEELSNMKRLSEFEIQGVKPSFDRIVAFLGTHQQQVADANTKDPVAQVEENLLDLPVTKGKGKKKHRK